jgi:hypothetical protein
VCKTFSCLKNVHFAIKWHTHIVPIFFIINESSFALDSEIQLRSDFLDLCVIVIKRVIFVLLFFFTTFYMNLSFDTSDVDFCVNAHRLEWFDLASLVIFCSLGSLACGNKLGSFINRNRKMLATLCS